jgi:menaquinol-cytochrome c reductase iron-sulfur subunit
MERRSFLEWAIAGISSLFGMIVAIPGISYLIDPRNRPAPSGDFKRVAKLSELEQDVPHQVVIRDVRQDAWTYHPSDLVGRVWLVRRDDRNVDAYTTICSHLGCSINFIQSSKLFICPCHKGTWKLTGDRIDGPVPRDMDMLDTQIVKDGDDSYIEVQYKNFRQGEAEKIEKV